MTWLNYAGLSRQEFGNSTNIGWKQRPQKIVLHSTEGGGYPSAATYKQGKSAPHITVDVRGRTARQHYSLAEGAWALAAPGGISTNSMGAIQIEIIGTCVVGRSPSVLNFDAGDLAYLLGLLRAISAATGIPLTSSVNWTAYPASYGTKAAQRLSVVAWNAYRGILGHQHVPGNSHGDPGDFPIAALLGAGSVATPASNPVAVAQPTRDYLQKGDTGPRVMTLQNQLSALGYSLGVWGADGSFGGDTVLAVKQLQKNAGLATDGIAGSDTRAAIARGVRAGATAPVAAPADSRARNKDGSLTLTLDGLRGQASIGRWQECLGLAVDFFISSPVSNTIKADQVFLNSVVAKTHIKNLTGKVALDTDGKEGKNTIKVRQFWLYNQYAQALLGRGVKAGDFDGIDGIETTKLHQYALNQATSGSGRY